VKKVLIIVQARMGSSRLPGKVLKKINGATVIEILLSRLAKIKSNKKIVVATSTRPENDILEQHLKYLGIPCERGSENDVLGRYHQVSMKYSSDAIIRITGDCPLIDPKLIDQVITFTIDRKLDYGSNMLIENYPDGQDIEVFTFKALEKAHQSAQLDSEKEHVTPYIIKRSTFRGGNQFKAENFPSSIDYSGVRMTVDEPQDYLTIKTLVKELGIVAGWNEYTQYILNYPAKFSNQKIIRNEGYLNSLKKEQSGK